MGNYLISIKIAIIVFPLITFIFTMPYIIFLYRKYGSISLFRTLIVYSFILYLITIYFLVILPLPKISDVAKYTTPYVQLIPFKFIVDFLNNTSLVINNVHTYILAMKETYFYTVIFNLFILVPFGIYLRYYFKCSFKKTILLSFLLSLFFELTQISGLYLIYPRPYRLFDVDDLIINTLGGIVGYAITPILSKILPSRESIDNKSYMKGKKVSYFRRLLALMFDLIFIMFVMIFINNILNIQLKYYHIFTIIIMYFTILPIIFNGKSFGKMVVRIKLAPLNNNNIKFYQYFLRAFFLYGLFIIPFLIFKVLDINLNGLQYLISILLFLGFSIYYTCILFSIITRKRVLIYEKISGLINISDIIIEDKSNQESKTVVKGFIIGDEKNMKKSKVYFTKNITPENVIKMYKILNKELNGKVAVKVHSGEAGNQNYLHPEFMKPMIDYVNGTVVECNTAYDGQRNTTKKHKKLVEDHGWTKYFNVDIMDAKGPDLKLEIPNGKVIKENFLGKNISNYDSMLVLSHFKGHPMGGYGGALKQLSIGCASSEGKAWIHSAGKTKNQKILWNNLPEQDKFLEAMADAASSIVKYFDGNIVFINIMANMSVDCDCCAKAEDPCMQDIGILSSTDPIALDQACIDLVYNSNDPGRNHLVERIERQNGTYIIDAAVDLGFGTKEYELINIDEK